MEYGELNRLMDDLLYNLNKAITLRSRIKGVVSLNPFYDIHHYKGQVEDVVGLSQRLLDFDT